MVKDISVFDVIGPNMIGPSSSHTAGALKIALLARKICKGKIKKVEFILYGSFAQTYKGHGTDKALIAGILGFNTEDYRIKNSFYYANEQKLEYEFILDKQTTDTHPNTVDIIITNDKDITTQIRGVSVGGGKIEIVQINGIKVKLSGIYHTILIKQKDSKGVIAYITKCLSDNNINIAFMRLYRESKGEIAYTVIETDDIIPNDIVGKIEKLSLIQRAILII